MLDRVHARSDRIAHRMVAGGVGGDLLAHRMGFLDDRLQLVDVQDIGAVADDDLDQVRAVIDRLALRRAPAPGRKSPHIPSRSGAGPPPSSPGIGPPPGPEPGWRPACAGPGPTPWRSPSAEPRRR